MAQTEPQPNFPDCWLAYGATNDLLREFGRSQPLAGAPGAGGLLPFQVVLATAFTVTVVLDLPVLVRVVAGLLALLLWASAAAGVWMWRSAPRAIELGPDGLVARQPLRRQRTVPWERIASIDPITAAGRAGVGISLGAGNPRSSPKRSKSSPRLGGSDLLLWPVDGDHERLARVLLRYCLDPRARRRYLAEAPAASA